MAKSGSLLDIINALVSILLSNKIAIDKKFKLPAELGLADRNIGIAKSQQKD